MSSLDHTRYSVVYLSNASGGCRGPYVAITAALGVTPRVLKAEAINRLALLFKVSTLAILRRLFDTKYLSSAEYRDAYNREQDRVLQIIASQERGGGGDFCNTTPVRTSKRFARAVILSTHEGNTLYRDAARLLGFKKVSTLDQSGHRLGVA